MGGKMGTDAIIAAAAVPPDAEIHLRGSFGSGDVWIGTAAGRRFEVPLHVFLSSIRDRPGRAVRVHTDFGPARTFVLSVVSCSDGQCAVQPSLNRAFEHEEEPNTAMIFASAECLINERLVEDNLKCLSNCGRNCNSQNWCGQPPLPGSTALYDLT